MKAPSRGSLASYVATSVLIVAVATGSVLVVMLAVRPPTSMKVVVGIPHATACPEGAGAPACFRIDLSNTGERDGVARCIVTPAPATVASFINGSRVNDVPLSAGQVQQLYVKVTPSGQGDTVYAPDIMCNPG